MRPFSLIFNAKCIKSVQIAGHEVHDPFGFSSLGGTLPTRVAGPGEKSLAGFAPFPVKNIYSATKCALIFFSYSPRYQLKEKNISVSCLCPGPVLTPIPGMAEVRAGISSAFILF